MGQPDEAVGVHDWAVLVNIHIPDVIRNEDGKFSFSWPAGMERNVIRAVMLGEIPIVCIKCEQTIVDAFGERCIG